MRPAREARVEIGGKVHLITSDDDYLQHIGERFEPPTVALLRAAAGGSEVILNVGANIGCTALLFAELAAKVVAFEPSASTFVFLKRNISRAGLRNVVLQNYGLGAVAGEYTLTFSPANRSGGFVSDRTAAGALYVSEKIEIRTMDAAVKSLGLERVDFVKIDVEGFEGHVLRGAPATLARYRPVVVLELNHWCLNAFQRTSIPDFLDLLRSIFPVLAAVDGQNYLDLHDADDSYIVMYHHILHMRYPNILAAFDEDRLRPFRAAYGRGFVP